jgi:hypothetical protein
MPSLLSLDELRREAVPMKGRSRGETGYSSADDQDRRDLCHISSDCGAPDQSCRSEKATQMGKRRSWIEGNSDLDQSEIMR